MFAIPEAPLGACKLARQCWGVQSARASTSTSTCVKRVESALRQACEDFPSHAAILSRLKVEHASLDTVCLADHEERRFFTSVRGTDPSLNMLTAPRDFNNDVLILFGFPPSRTAVVTTDYAKVMPRFQGYKSFGTGHSLGGNIIQHVAASVENSPLCFDRIDVFNSAASPLQRVSPSFNQTSLKIHRVEGDLASWSSRGEVQVYRPRANISDRHSLRHFLPNNEEDRSGETRSGASSPSSPFAALTYFSCVCARKKQRGIAFAS